MDKQITHRSWQPNPISRAPVAQTREGARNERLFYVTQALIASRFLGRSEENMQNMLTRAMAYSTRKKRLGTYIYGHKPRAIARNRNGVRALASRNVYAKRREGEEEVGLPRQRQREGGVIIGNNITVSFLTLGAAPGPSAPHLGPPPPSAHRPSHRSMLRSLRRTRKAQGGAIPRRLARLSTKNCYGNTRCCSKRAIPGAACGPPADPR